MFVEYKKEGEPQGPSLEGFMAWLEQQNPDQVYDWSNPHICACGQYAGFIGQAHDWLFGRADHTSIWNRLNDLAQYARPHKFGALLEYIREENNARPGHPIA